MYSAQLSIFQIKLLALNLFVFLDLTFATAQLKEVWDYTYGGNSYDDLQKIIEIRDHGFLLAGSSNSDSSADKSQPNWSSYIDYWIVKTDSNGQKEWDKTYGGTGSDILVDVIQTKDGGFLLGGFTDSDSSGNLSEKSRGGIDEWIVKIDSTGNLIWDKRFGGASLDFLNSIVETDDGGFLIGGGSKSDSNGDKSQDDWGNDYYSLGDMWLVKTDAFGNKKWDKRIGGLKGDACNSITKLSGGSFLIAGNSVSDSGGDKSENTWGNGDQDFWLLKIDSTGNKIWDRDYGGVQYEMLKSISTDDSGRIYLGGNSYSPISGNKTVANWDVPPDIDFWTLVLDSDGNIISDNHYGGIDDDILNNLMLTKDHELLISGYCNSEISGEKSEANGLNPNGPYNSNAWMIKVNTDGTKEWDKTLVNLDFNIIGVALETNDRGFVIATSSNAGIGGDKSQDCRGYTDYFFAKFRLPIEFTADSFLCQKECILFNNQTKYEAVSWEWLLPGGTPSTSTDKNPTVCYNNPGVFDVTLITFYGGKYDTLTKTNFITVTPTPITPVITQSNDTLISTFALGYQWYINQQIIAGASNQIYIATQAGQYAVEITDANGCNSFSENFEVGIFSPVNNLQLQIFPNPASDLLNINFSSSTYSEIQLKIINPLGQLLFQSEMKNGKQLQINTAAFNGNGMVYCQFLINEMLLETQKVFIANY